MGRQPVPILHGGRRTAAWGADGEPSFTGRGPTMKHAISQELYGYWDRLRGGEPAPKRSDIEPSDIRRILADTFILEAGAREGHVVRLAGTRICGLYCRELRGMNFLDLWVADDRQAVATLVAAVSDDGAGAVVTADARTARARSVTCEIVLLPLRHGAGAYDRIVGSVAALERPYWLGAEPVVSQAVSSLRLLPPADPRRVRRRQEDWPVPFPASRAGTRRRGHLFILDGGKD